MAQIALLHSNQKESETPRRWRKASIIKRLVKKGAAEWIVKGELARMVPLEQIKAQKLAAHTLRHPWESPEIPGLTFADPMRTRHNPEAVIVRFLKPSHV